jgi:hypothetical protein
MAAVRSMAAGSSTDVPPNFMTTKLMRIFLILQYRFGVCVNRP